MKILCPQHHLPTLLATLAFTVFPPAWVAAQPEFIARNWYVEDGLPHNGVTNVIRDARGFLWLGTSAGVARFDGRNFIEYPMPDDLALGRYNIRDLAIEDDRTMIMINAANKLIRLRDGVYELHPANAHLQDTVLRDLAVDATGAIWIGTDSPSLIRWTAVNGDPSGRVEIFANEPGLTRRAAPFCFVSDENKRTWIAAGDFLGWYEDGTIHRYEKENIHSIMITKSRNGGLWVASREKLARLDTARGTCATVLSGPDWPIPQVGLQNFYESKTGALWMATRRDGVLRLSDGRISPLPLRYDRVQSINEDINGDLWFGIYGSGLVHLKPNQHVLLNTKNGFPNDISISVTVDETGALWCANQSGGLVRVENNKASVVKTPDRSTPYTTNVCADQRGTVWVGTVNGLYSAPVATTSGTRVMTRLDVPMRNVQTLFSASNGDLWVSWNNQSLGFVRDGRLTELTDADGFPLKRVASIAERKGPQGAEIWIALESGSLFQATPNPATGEKKLVGKKLPPGSQAVQLHALFADTENRLWLGTTTGLVLLRDNAAPHLLTQADGLPDNIINQVTADGRGRLWVSSRRGIFHVSIKQLLDAADHPGKTINATLFGHDENLAGISGLVGGQPMAWKGNDGHLWFVTYRGIVGFDTLTLPDTQKPLPVYIDQVRVDNTLAPLPSQGPLFIGPRCNQLELHFAVLDYASPERTHIRRMLEGYDPDWKDARNETSCTYPALQPGRYVFRVEASNGDGGASRSQTSLTIIVAAAWWQTVWFRMCAILAGIATVAWFAWLITTRLLRQRLRRLEHENALARERTRIARDLHDELGGRVTKIGYIADCLSHEVTAPREKELAASLITQSRNLVEDLHDVVWTVNPRNDSWQQLAAYILRYTQRHLAGTPITVTIDGVGAIPDTPITPETRHNLLSITKEALNNMLKHSKATHATIGMNADETHFRMQLTDNGKGFNPDAPENNEGNGLFNMRARMAEIGGRMTIQSTPAQGTKILIETLLECRPPANNADKNRHR